MYMITTIEVCQLHGAHSAAFLFPLGSLRDFRVGCTAACGDMIRLKGIDAIGVSSSETVVSIGDRGDQSPKLSSV